MVVVLVIVGIVLAIVITNNIKAGKTAFGGTTCACTTSLHSLSLLIHPIELFYSLLIYSLVRFLPTPAFSSWHGEHGLNAHCFEFLRCLHQFNRISFDE